MRSVFTEGEFKVFADRKREDGRLLKNHSHHTAQVEKIRDWGQHVQFLDMQVSGDPTAGYQVGQAIEAHEKTGFPAT
jgi:hypothetical protein